MMQVKPIYELILWDNCSNNCSFCWQKHNGNVFDSNSMILSLNAVERFIKNENYEIGSHLLLVGGEIFDRQTTHNVSIRLKEVYDVIIQKMLSDKIELLYINTNLIYDTQFLETILNMFSENNLFSRIKFTTSYDVYGRFKTKDHEKLFLNNLTKLNTKYQDLKIVVNSIMTKELCRLLAHTTYRQLVIIPDNVEFNLIPYIGGDKEIKPNKNDVFKVLLQEEKIKPGFLSTYIKNFDLKQEKIVLRYNKSKNFYEDFGSETASCGHGINFKRYSFSDSCFICDIKELFSAYVK